MKFIECASTLYMISIIILNITAIVFTSGPHDTGANMASLQAVPTATSSVANTSYTAALYPNIKVAVAPNTQSTPLLNHSLHAITTTVPDELKLAAEHEAHTTALARHLAANDQTLYEQAYAEGYAQGYDRAHYSAHDRIVSFYGSGYLPDGTPCSGLCQWRVSDRDALAEHGENDGQRVGAVKQVAARAKERDDVVPDRVIGLAACTGRCSGL